MTMAKFSHVGHNIICAACSSMIPIKLKDCLINPHMLMLIPNKRYSFLSFRLAAIFGDRRFLMVIQCRISAFSKYTLPM